MSHITPHPNNEWPTFWTMIVNTPGCLPEADKVIYYPSAEAAITAAIDDRIVHLADFDLDPDRDNVVINARAILTMIRETSYQPPSYFGPTFRGSTPGYDHSDPKHDHDLGLVYTVAPVMWTDWLGEFTYEQFKDAVRDYFDSLEEDEGGLNGLDPDGANTVLSYVQLKYAMANAIQNRAVDLNGDPQRFDEGWTLSEIWPYVGKLGTEFDSVEEIAELLVEILWEENL